MYRTSVVSSLLAAVLFVGVASAQSGPQTWSKDVVPIIQERCQECHRPGHIGPMSVMSFGEACPCAAAIKKRVAHKPDPKELYGKYLQRHLLSVVDTVRKADHAD